MRLLSYNIFNGGIGRADPIAEVILAQRPDVVALIEADDPLVVDRIARRLDMDHVVGRGQLDGSAVLSRWPIRETVNHAAFSAALTRSCVEAVVVSPSGRAWPVVALHLQSGATEARRGRPAGRAGGRPRRLRGHREAGRPHVVCGDFNSNAAYQRIDPARCKGKTRRAWKANGDRLPTRVVDTMAAHGYADAYHVRHDERREMVGSFTTRHPGQRVDYVFTFGLPAAGVRDAWIEQDRMAEYASDHFPIGVEIAEGF